VYYPKDRLEIIVVDDGSTDDTPNVMNKLLKNYPLNLKYVRSNHNGVAKARNIGIQNAGKSIILFLDSDVICDPYLLYFHGLNYLHHETIAVAGKIEYEGKSNFVSKCWEAMPWIRIQKMDKTFYKKHRLWAPSGNLSFRKAYLQNMNIMFDESLVFGEDIDFCLRVTAKGFKIISEPQAIVYHTRERIRSLKYCTKNVFHRGKNEVLLLLKYPRRRRFKIYLLITFAFLILFSAISSLFNFDLCKIISTFLFFLNLDFFIQLRRYIHDEYYLSLFKPYELILVWLISFIWRCSYEMGKIIEIIKLKKITLLFTEFIYI